jgi:ABC-type phosphate/phosphonate transport system ATPase subunit
MPFILIPLIAIAAGHKHAADRAVDVQRQQYALQVAEFNMKYHTNLSATKKNVIVYDAKTGTVSNQNINDVYHKAGHKSISQ